MATYHYCLLLVQTNTKHIFGAFITSFPIVTSKIKFNGTDESFVFIIDQEEVIFYDASRKNQYYMISQHLNLTIGSEGDGPAIILDKDLFNGSTNACATFDSPILVIDGKKHQDD